MTPVAFNAGADSLAIGRESQIGKAVTIEAGVTGVAGVTVVKA